jgi:hypothetical protein
VSCPSCQALSADLDTLHAKLAVIPRIKRSRPDPEERPPVASPSGNLDGSDHPEDGLPGAKRHQHSLDVPSGAHTPGSHVRPMDVTQFGDHTVHPEHSEITPRAWMHTSSNARHHLALDSNMQPDIDLDVVAYIAEPELEVPACDPGSALLQLANIAEAEKKSEGDTQISTIDALAAAAAAELPTVNCRGIHICSSLWSKIEFEHGASRVRFRCVTLDAVHGTVPKMSFPGRRGTVKVLVLLHSSRSMIDAHIAFRLAPLLLES